MPPLRRATAVDPLRAVVERAPVRDLDGLRSQLRDPDAGQRRHAARDLAAHPAAIPALGAALATEADPSVREALFIALASLPGEETVRTLLPLLRSDDAMLRNGAIEALAAMPQAAAGQLQALLADGDPDVRLFAVNLMTDLRHPDVPRWLEQVLRHEREVNVVAAAIDVLAEVGTPAQRPALADAVRRFPDDPFIGFAADVAASRLGAP